MPKLSQQVADLELEAQKLRHALEQYALPENWLPYQRPDGPRMCWASSITDERGADGFHLARQALLTVRPPPPPPPPRTSNSPTTAPSRRALTVAQPAPASPATGAATATAPSSAAAASPATSSSTPSCSSSR